MKTKLLFKKEVTKKQVTTFAVSNDNKLLAYATNEEDYLIGNSIFVFEIETQKPVAQFQSKNFRTIKFLLFIPGTSYLAHVVENEVTINDIASGKLVFQTNISAKVSAISIIGNNLAISFLTGVTCFNTETWEEEAINDELKSLIYVRGYDEFYAGINTSGRIILNNIKNNSPVLFDTPFVCTSVLLSRNQNLISGSCYSGTGFYLFDIKTQQEIKPDYPFNSMKVPVWDFNYSATRLALAADTGMLTILNLENFETIAFEPLHKGPITNLLFIDDSNIISSGLDGKLLISNL
ncbi:hypothetical protein BH11BAC7_BH11BAC7_16600 [soil metagenome]